MNDQVPTAGKRETKFSSLVIEFRQQEERRRVCIENLIEKTRQIHPLQSPDEEKVSDKRDPAMSVVYSFIDILDKIRYDNNKLEYLLENLRDFI